MGTTVGTQCLWSIGASREASPLRHSDGLRPGHRSSLPRIGRKPVLYCTKLGAQVWRAHPVVLFSLAMQEVFSIRSSFMLVSEKYFFFDENIYFCTHKCC